MKRLLSKATLLPLLSIVILISATTPQNIYSQGSRTRQIDFSQIPPEVYEPQKFRIKFKDVAEKQLETPQTLKSLSGISITGIKEVDALNRQFSVVKGKALLADIYHSSLKSSTLRKEKHKNNSLHLWYEFETSEKINISHLISQYQKLESVEIVEPVFKIVPIQPVSNSPKTSQDKNPVRETWIPNDNLFSEQWHYHNTGQTAGVEDADIDLPEAWEFIQGNPDVIVAVIDQGVDFNHPDLAGNIWQGIGPEGEATLPGNHGTHVAGTIAALNQNGTGVSGIAGGSGNNDGVRIMSLDLFDGQHGMSTLEMNVWAADNGAAISQNSWGYMGPDYYNQSDLDGIDYFNEYGGGTIMQGGITFFAAGNDSDDGNWYPGCYEGAIAVAATNHNDQVSWYSNYGEWVDISAPGGETDYNYEEGVLSTISNGGYDFYQGTSMACPHVSGVAALILSQAPQYLTNDELATILLSSTDNHYASNPQYQGLLGTGRLNALKALEMVQEYLGNVKNPPSFNAEAKSETAIQLNWELNENGNPVMIAMSANGEFGSPEDGTSYTTEQELQGGGVIKYIGSDLTKELQELERNTTYHFRIWSFDENNEYSYGRLAQTKTFSPQLEISTLLIDYGQVYIGHPKGRTIEIQNQGTSELVISETAFSSDEFSSSQIPASIQPGDTYSWEIIFDPLQVQSYSENLSFSTNAPDAENITIALTANSSDQIPLLVYSPTEIEETLNSGEITTRLIELTNNGDGNLNFNVDIQEEHTSLEKNLKAPSTQVPEYYTPVTKGQLIEPSFTDREIKESGGSKEAGYLWNTTTLDWYDTSDGTMISLGDDDTKNDIPLGFSFKYYENTYTSINVKSNGWVSFNNPNVWFPECIPGGSGTICPFGVDLLPDENSFIAYKVFGTEPARKFVVEYNNIPLYSSDIRNTFQIVFSEGRNTILFQYQEVGTTPYLAGIDNIDGTKGIGSCGAEETFLNPEIIANNMGIRFSPATWSNIPISSGTIEPGQSTTLSLQIDATNLVENTYLSDIIITNNDPRMEVVTIPLTLNVIGVPDFQAASNTVLLPPTYLGTTSSASFTIDNTNGTGSLTISDITSSGPPFEVETIPETVSPRETETIQILFSPDQKKLYEGSFTIFSNDPEIPEKTITIIGEGIIAPGISASSDRFDIEALSGDSCNRTLTISNEVANSIPLEVAINLATDKKPLGTAKLTKGVPTDLKSFAPATRKNLGKIQKSNPAPKSDNGFNVLFLNTLQESGTNFHQAIENLPTIANVDSVDISFQTPNTEYLLHYDVVLLATNTPIASGGIFGDMLADYIDLGGNLCVLNGALSAGGGWTLSGRITESGYLPVEINDYTFSPTSCNSFTKHPLTENLTLLETSIYSFVVPQGPGVSLGTFDSGYSCITYNSEKPIVAINMFPSDGNYNDDLITLMGNTIEWLGDYNRWMRVDKNVLSIEESTSQEVTLTFDASGLEPGEYTGNIHLNSNSPATSSLSIPVTFNVTEAPGISIDHSEFDFSEVPIEVRSSTPRKISNTGSSPLEITALTVSGQYFECYETAPITIAPGETTYLNIAFTPESAIEVNGQLTIVS
ncbi:S8 family serine peptidase, partial [Marinilabilia sp.]|uniref:S8 family serine peptidase n=1 Tax=Marinilabilia sp. TaxID=2021252 RepID=UPI0025BBD35B